MEKRERIYEGKAKIVYNTDDPDLIIQYLRAISEADGNVSKEEELLLQSIASGLGITLNQNSN